MNDNVKRNVTKFILQWGEGDEKEDLVRIQIVEGPYDGVAYHYQTVGFDEGDPPALKFVYVVDYNPEDLQLEDNADFIEVIGDILQELITREMDKEQQDGT